MDFSNFWLFFTFFDVEWAYDDQFSSPVWQMKGMFSTPKDIWLKNGSLPSKYRLYAFKVGKYELLPAIFGDH